MNDLKPWAGVGPVKYFENTAALTAGTTPSGEPCVHLGDGVPVGTIYARNTHKKRNTWWLTWESSGDLSYWIAAAEMARDNNLLLKIRAAPLLVWGTTGQPDNIETWGPRGGWLDTNHIATIGKFSAWITAIRDAVLGIWPHVIFDAAMLGRVGEPRMDDVPVDLRALYQEHNNRLLEIYDAVYDINRCIVFLYESSAGHADNGNHGFDYLTKVQALGKPAGARQDGYGSANKYGEYDLLKGHPLGAQLLGPDYPLWWEQWGGDIKAWHTDVNVTVIGPPSEHYRRSIEDYFGASVAHMGWTVRMNPHAAENVDSFQGYWSRAQDFGRAQIAAMFGRIHIPPPSTGSTVTVTGGYISYAIQRPGVEFHGAPNVTTKTFPGDPWRVHIEPQQTSGVENVFYEGGEDIDGADALTDTEMINFRTVSGADVDVSIVYEAPPPPDGDLEARVAALEEEVATLKTDASVGAEERAAMQASIDMILERLERVQTAWQ